MEIRCSYFSSDKLPDYNVINDIYNDYNNNLKRNKFFQKYKGIEYFKFMWMVNKYPHVFYLENTYKVKKDCEYYYYNHKYIYKRSDKKQFFVLLKDDEGEYKFHEVLNLTDRPESNTFDEFEVSSTPITEQDMDRIIKRLS
jgi:hypothetical protein